MNKENSNDFSLEVLFENLPELLTPIKVAEMLSLSVKTIYDWHYRPKNRIAAVPAGLFIKFNRLLYLRTEVLRKWVVSQNPSFV